MSIADLFFCVHFGSFTNLAVNKAPLIICKMKHIFLSFFVLFSFNSIARCQDLAHFADSIREAYLVPELVYAVVSADSIFEMHALGNKRVGAQLPADINDRFRIGSNTKAITGFIAARMVKNGDLSWDTKFFDKFQELRSKSNEGYFDMTLLDLLTFRTGLIKYTYTDSLPLKEQFSGTEYFQRYGFMQWVLQRPPVPHAKHALCFSNPGYTLAGFMEERAGAKSYQILVSELGNELGIDFGFGPPNATDTLQPWGHDANLIPEPPADNYKLNWLMAAGNLNVSMPGYVKWIQLQLNGLQGKSTLLTQKEFEFLHFGRPEFAVGWFWEKNRAKHKVSHNTGNPGTFLSYIYVDKDADKAIIIFSNAQTAKADEAFGLLIDEIKSKYGIL